MSLDGSSQHSYQHPHHHHGFSSPTDVSVTSPTILTKLELPLHQLIQGGLHSPTDLPDHHFMAQQQQSMAMDSPSCSSPDLGAYSPTLETQYQHQHHDANQHQHQQDDFAQTFSSYSEAAAALSLSSFQHHHQHQHQQHQHSPILIHPDLFHKQIQQDHRFQQLEQDQQQQELKQEHDHVHGHSFLSESLITSALAAAAVATSTASAVPAMTCESISTSIPTPTTGSPLSSLLDDQDELDRCHLSAVAELVAAEL